MHQLLRTAVGLNRSWLSQKRTRYRRRPPHHPGGRGQPHSWPGWRLTGEQWPDSDWWPPLRWEGSPQLPWGPEIRSYHCRDSNYPPLTLINLWVRCRETAEKVSNETDTHIAEVVDPIEDVDIIGHDWVVLDMSGGGGGSLRPGLTCKERRLGEVSGDWRRLPLVSSALIVRLVSHEPISPLSAKRGFWKTKDTSWSSPQSIKSWAGDLQFNLLKSGIDYYQPS